jgi:threonine dehydrogenase-like Zn-dependent dehydrogenase
VLVKAVVYQGPFEVAVENDMIIAGRAHPSLLVSHEVSLTEAADADQKFDKRVDGYTKVLMHPAT